MKKTCKMCEDCANCDASTCKCPCHDCKCPMGGCCGGKKGQMSGSGGDTVYCLGGIGAAIYFISNASGFWTVVLAILKAIVWPVFLVLEAFKALIG